MAAPLVLLVQLPHVRSSPAANAVPSGVMPVGGVAPAIDDVAFFGKRSLLGQVILGMQLRDILGDDDALGIGPGTFADAIACIGRRLAVGGLRAQISVPGMAGGTGGLREVLATLVR